MQLPVSCADLQQEDHLIRELPIRLAEFTHVIETNHQVRCMD